METLPITEDQSLFLFNDTETTGFKRKGALIQDGQARICQIALLLTDAVGKSLCEFSALIKPNGWQVSQFNIDSCGITQRACEVAGLDMRTVFMMYHKLASVAEVVIAHNAEFDHGMMKIEEAYFNSIRSEPIVVQTPWACTMKPYGESAKYGIKYPPGKWPKLEEHYQLHCGKSLGDNAHDAMFDVKACRDIFFAQRGIKVAA